MHRVNYSITIEPDKGICAYIQVKPLHRVSEENITTLIRQTIGKIQDIME